MEWHFWRFNLRWSKIIVKKVLQVTPVAQAMVVLTIINQERIRTTRLNRAIPEQNFCTIRC